MWRPADEDRVLLMAGRTADYAMEPRGEYVFGVVAGAPMRSCRGRARRLVRPGELVAWDPSQGHRGTAVNGRAWSSRLMVVEVADIAALTSDDDLSPLTDIAFPEPVIADPALTNHFLRLHAALALSGSRLERDEQLSNWLLALVERSSAVRRSPPTLTPHDDRALHRAQDYLGDQLARNVSLDELAAAAGVGKFRLVRLSRARPAAPRVPSGAPHSRRAPPTRERRDGGRHRGRDRLRRPEPPSPPFPAQPWSHPSPVPTAVHRLSGRRVEQSRAAGSSAKRRVRCRPASYQRTTQRRRLESTPVIPDQAVNLTRGGALSVQT
jgi:hypothetical protein